jgi:hypothetical protein
MVELHSSTLTLRRCDERIAELSRAAANTAGPSLLLLLLMLLMLLMLLLSLLVRLYMPADRVLC